LAIREAIRLCEQNLSEYGYDSAWAEAIGTYLAVTLDKTADYSSSSCTWHKVVEAIRNTFGRFALPITWDYAENAILNDVGGSFVAQLDWVVRYIKTAMVDTKNALQPSLTRQSATQPLGQLFDAIVTDPPYYDSIPYSDCMDFFYVWLKRLTHGTRLEQGLFAGLLSPKWDGKAQDGELIDDASRHGNDKEASKKAYEDGMARAFAHCHESLAPQGRLVVVFAHKQPNAWETLVSAIIRSGFTVTASWPIQTEMPNRTRGISSAALSSSVWLVCRKRPETAKPGWDSQVLSLMEENITLKLREFWDAGLRGPDFVWAATGPALAAYSDHPVVKKTATPGETLTVTEFLTQVRRLVVKFVVGRLLPPNPDGRPGDPGMDGLTSYYLLHRHDFGLAKAPAGACILYATACGLTDRDLESTYHLITRKTPKRAAPDLGDLDDEDDEDEESDDFELGAGANGGDEFALEPWFRRTQKSLGLEGPKGGPVPLIDKAHKLMSLWKAGDVSQVNSYIDSFALSGDQLFLQLIQALTELSANSERSLLESIGNHLHVQKPVLADGQRKLDW
jgi:hypothetical protein